MASIHSAAFLSDGWDEADKIQVFSSSIDLVPVKHAIPAYVSFTYRSLASLLSVANKFCNFPFHVTPPFCKNI